MKKILQIDNLDLMKAMDEGQIILVNLGESEFLDRKAAGTFAALLINQLQKPKQEE